MDAGRVNPDRRLENQGIEGLGRVYYNLVEPDLVRESLNRGEAQLGNGGVLLVTTGKHTGRSPGDKFVVHSPAIEGDIWWENNARMEPEAFETLRADMFEHMKGRDYFVQDLYGGADPAHRLDVRLVTELAWHGLFIRHLLRRPGAPNWTATSPSSRWSIVPASSPIPSGTDAAARP